MSSLFGVRYDQSTILTGHTPTLVCCFFCHYAFFPHFPVTAALTSPIFLIHRLTERTFILIRSPTSAFHLFHMTGLCSSRDQQTSTCVLGWNKVHNYIILWAEPHISLFTCHFITTAGYPAVHCKCYGLWVGGAWGLFLHTLELTRLNS